MERKGMERTANLKERKEMEQEENEGKGMGRKGME